MEKFIFTQAILIPSLKRIKNPKSGTMMIDACLENLFRYYDATNVIVVAQEYSEEDKEFLINKFPTVTWEWHEKRMGIINTFNRVKDIGCKYPMYVHHDDDVIHTHSFSMNPALNAFEQLMKMDINRIGIVTAPSISIHHFKKASPNFLDLHCNPAQLVLINSKAAKDCKYDERFANFRSDTDFTMQIANKGFIPLIINQMFSFMHTVPLSKIIKKEGGGRKFETLDNVTETRGSLGGNRNDENRKREYDQFQEKWPKVITFSTYKQQMLKKSVVHLTGFKENELIKYEKGFDFSVINDPVEHYYKRNVIEDLKNKYNVEPVF
jgi:hypothetical protein